MVFVIETDLFVHRWQSLTFLATDGCRGVVVVVALANNDLDPASYSTVILFARNLDDVIFGFDGGSDVIGDLTFQHTIRPVVQWGWSVVGTRTRVSLRQGILHFIVTFRYLVCVA